MQHAAFSAIVGTGVVAEAVTFAFPPALLMWRGRAPQYLPKNTPYNLGWMGWLANSIVVFWGLFAAVIYSIPLARPVTVSNMSQCILFLFLFLAPSRSALTSGVRLHERCARRYGGSCDHQLGYLCSKALPGAPSHFDRGRLSSLRLLLVMLSYVLFLENTPP